MNIHIINCDENQFLNQYRSNGYIGVGIVINSTSPRALSNACKTTYSMYADMKTVFPGDMVFVHAGEFIYGVFKAESLFKEDPNVNHDFLSPNIHYNTKTNQPNSGWRNLANQPLSGLNLPNDYRQLSISHFVDDATGNNLCFENGFLANEVFDLKRKGKVWSIPERWKYPDAARTVRPIMPTEARELIKLLERENSNNRLKIVPKDLASFADIKLILDPHIVEDEKIVEAWLCENLRTPRLQNVFGNITSFGNNVQMGYLQEIDIFGYVEGSSGSCKYKVIEIKKDPLNFNDDIQNHKGYLKRTLEYMQWVIEYLADGDPKLVEGYIVARGFDESCKNFVGQHNTLNIGRQLSLIQFDYVRPEYITLSELTK